MVAILWERISFYGSSKYIEIINETILYRDRNCTEHYIARLRRSFRTTVSLIDRKQ